ncbi:MAG: hypothetical protein EZS28_032251 [Streblomastix strix]|uniref:Uncharacterized protein n=1 Tax=Streblomastix strix TaxID=222440 RepID=A0A5J4UQ77_9EUKA|nr:MAG: hypothetical protein EZS28_032251 [Streblomastix strix]
MGDYGFVQAWEVGNHFGSKTCIQSHVNKRGSQQMVGIGINAKSFHSPDEKGTIQSKNFNESYGLLGQLRPQRQQDQFNHLLSTKAKHLQDIAIQTPQKINRLTQENEYRQFST